MTKFDPKQEALLAQMSPQARAAAEKLVASGDQKAIVQTGVSMALLSAAQAHKRDQISIEQFYDVAKAAIQLIWCEAGNQLAESILREESKDPEQALAMILTVGMPAAQTASRRLLNLIEMCAPEGEG